MRLVTLEKSPFIRMLAYGDSGSGKTTLIGSFHIEPETSPLIVLNAGGQPVSLRFLDPPPLVLTVEDVADINEPYNWFLAGQPWETVALRRKTSKQASFFSSVYDYFGGEPGVFKTVALDSITHMQQVALRKIVGGKTSMPGTPLPQAQIQHWGTVRGQTNNIADLFYQLPMHVVITALQAHLFIEAYGLNEYGPLLNTKSAMEVPSYAEMVGRLMNLDDLASKTLRAIKSDTKIPDDAFNVFFTRGGRDFIAKWQGVVKPPTHIINPTARKLLDIMAQD